MTRPRPAPSACLRQPARTGSSWLTGACSLLMGMSLGPGAAHAAPAQSEGPKAAAPAPTAPEPEAPEQAFQALAPRIDDLLRSGLAAVLPAPTTGSKPATPRITIEVGQLDPRLRLAPCSKIDPYLPAGLPAWGRTRIGLKCSQGSKPWNVTLPVTVHAYAPAQVLASALRAGTPLEASHLITAEVDLAAAPGTAVMEASTVIGRVLNRPLAAGTTLRLPDLKPRQWFAAGDTVRVLAGGSGWQIATEGQAMSPGLEGQLVKIRTENGRVLQGRPTADRQVEVKL